MASSLDELQPNDYFQEELEVFLEDYSIAKDISSEKIFILNHFIEYACFQKNLGSFDQFTLELLEEFFNSVSLILPDQKKEAIHQTLKDYFLFIHNLKKSVPEFLLTL